MPGQQFSPEGGSTPTAQDRVRVLIVDDDPEYRRLSRRILESSQRIEIVGEAADADECYERAAALVPDVVLMDVRLPRTSGVDATRRLKMLVPKTEIIGLTVFADRSTLRDLIEAGASSYVVKGDEHTQLVAAVLAAKSGAALLSPQIARTLVDEAATLYKLERDRERERAELLNILAETLAATIDSRDAATGEHLRRVVTLAQTVLTKLDPAAASRETTRYGLWLHDVGKIHIRDSILLKPGPLDATEWGQMRRHPELGVEILKRAAEPLRETLTIVRHHHERWDGTGYPDGLAGQRIPVACRALAVADSFDAMTEDRPYRPAMPVARAIDELWQGRAKQFDPDAVDAFLLIIEQEPSPVQP